jgi:hypothetical protein
MIKSLQGAWERRAERDSLESDILFIYPDGRVVQFMRTGEYKSKPVPLYFKLEKDGPFHLKAGHIKMRREGSNLVVKVLGQTVVWNPLGEELPRLYKNILDKIVWPADCRPPKKRAARNRRLAA